MSRIAWGFGDHTFRTTGLGYFSMHTRLFGNTKTAAPDTRNCHNHEFTLRTSEWRNSPTTLITSCNIRGCSGAFIQQIMQKGDIIEAKPLAYRDLLNFSHFYARNGAPVRCRHVGGRHYHDTFTKFAPRTQEKTLPIIIFLGRY